MKAEKLLDAIGEISDQLITEADPTQKKTKKPTFKKYWNWTRIGSVAAVFVFCCIAVWAITRVSFSDKASFDTAATESASPEGIAVDDSADVEAAENDTDGISKNESSTDGNYDVKEDLSYTLVIDDAYYYDVISFEERKAYGLVPEDAMGLTEKNTYEITSQDLGTVIGTVTDCAKAEWIGATLYHFTSYPDDNTIGILEYEGTYTFYVKQEFH